MPEPPSPLWTLGAVALGGLLSVVGTIVADLLRLRADLRRETRNRLRTNLYDLQDQLMEAFASARTLAKDINDPLKPAAAFFIDRTDLQNAIGRTSKYTARVGDDPLAEHVNATLQHLFKVTDPANDASKILSDAHVSYNDVQMRVGELLHANTAVDLGLDRDKRWWKPRWLAR